MSILNSKAPLRAAKHVSAKEKEPDNYRDDCQGAPASGIHRLCRFTQLVIEISDDRVKVVHGNLATDVCVVNSVVK